MLYWLKAAVWLHAALAVLAAIGFFYFLFGTRFWFPTHVHWLAAIALGIGLEDRQRPARLVARIVMTASDFLARCAAAADK